MLERGHQEDGVDLGGKASVGVRQLQLELEVAHGPEATDHEPGPLPASELDGQALERLDRHRAAEIGDTGLDERHPLGCREKGLLGGVAQDANDEPIEEARRAADDIEMRVGDGVERAGEDRDAVHGTRSLVSGTMRVRNVSVVSPNRRTRTCTSPGGSGTGVRQKCLTTTVPPSSICAARR